MKGRHHPAGIALAVHIASVDVASFARLDNPPRAGIVYGRI